MYWIESGANTSNESGRQLHAPPRFMPNSKLLSEKRIKFKVHSHIFATETK